jgi:hypothetical protein
MTDAFLTVGPPELQGLLETTVSRLIDPSTVLLDFETQPAGLTLGVGGENLSAPVQSTVIVGSTNTLSADPTPILNGRVYTFVSWSDGGAATHDVVAPAAPATFTAVYARVPACDDGIDNDVDGAVDWDGAGVAAPDPQCQGDPARNERPPPRCGLGIEAGLLLPLLWAARRRGALLSWRPGLRTRRRRAPAPRRPARGPA